MPLVLHRPNWYGRVTAAEADRVIAGRPYDDPGQLVTRRILQCVTGEMTVKQAMDTAASETETFLKGHGYYK